MINPPYNLNVLGFPPAQGLKNLSGQSASVISAVELTMVNMNNECKKACGSDEKRAQIESELTELLQRKCYTIGPCKTSGDYVLDNVVSEVDFKKMVDGVVAQCKSQCNVNTYKCDNYSQCRVNKTSKLILGENSLFSDVHYGVGGRPSDVCQQDASGRYADCPQPDENLSYCQYTQYQEALGWYIELDLPSACPNEQYARDFNCDPNNDTCVPKDSYEKTNTPLNGPNTVITDAVPVNITVQD